MKEKLLVGDCLETLKEIPDNSIDSVVTDPPYELGFMGKSWDSTGIAFDVKVWQECMRVLKPGGHLLAFSGSRTYHRMAVAIEDAGFEIRDQIMWIYGSGFPKSMAIDKAIDKTAPRSDMFSPLRKHIKEKRIEKGMTLSQVSSHFPSKTGGTTGRAHNWETGSNVPTFEQWQVLQKLLDLSNEWDPVIKREEALRETVGSKQAGIGTGSTYAFMSNNSESSKIIPITEPSTKEAKQWQGWGTALKPAHEPIVVARKPISEKTVAENVLTYGTGAINIDASRVGTTDIILETSNNNIKSNSYASNTSDRERDTTYTQNIQGRFPANLILSHNPDCQLIQEGSSEVSKEIGSKQDFRGDNFGRSDKTIDLERPVYKDTPEIYQCTEGCPFLEFPNTKATGSGKVSGSRKGGASENSIGLAGTKYAADGFSDSGTAARFFYCAKTSKSERNAGLNEFQEVKGHSNYGSIQERSSNPSQKNFHPTVKPLTLIRYLIKLVTPPKGTVLDPFLGSGTTAVAATLDGYNWVGCELTEEYLPIINGRVAYAKAEVAKAKKKKETTPTLFEEDKDVL